MIEKFGHKLRLSLVLIFSAFALNAQQYLISTAIGSATAGFSGDGGQAINANINNPMGMALDIQGNLYIADTYNQRVRMVDATTGIITTIAGNGIAGFSGDNGLATAAKLNYPVDVVLDAQGNIYISDNGNCRIRKVTVATGIITTVAGNGLTGFSGDGGAATAARIYWPQKITLDPQGHLFIADYQNNRIRRVDAGTGIITTFAGTGSAGFSGDGGAPSSAQLNGPSGVAFDAQGNLFIVDMNNNRIRKVDVLNGTISTIAGNGTAAFWGEGDPASAAIFYWPANLCFDTQGNTYIADYWNNRVRKINVNTGRITTIAGNGFVGASGDGGPSTAAQLNRPLDLLVTPQGIIYIADAFNNKIRKLTPCATVTAPTNQYVVCGSGNSVVLSVTGATSTSWSTGQQSSSISVAPITNTSYIVTYTDNVGCATTKSISVLFSPTLPVIAVNNPTICAGSLAIISPSGAANYSISGGSFTVSPTASASYSVFGTSSLGCPAGNVAVAYVFVSTPVVTITSGALFCLDDESITLSASGANSYTWTTSSPGGPILQFGSAIGIIPNNNVTYTVQGTNEFDCVNTANITLIADPCNSITNYSSEKYFLVYPNPVKEVLHFDYVSSNKQVFLVIYDLLGREAMRFSPEKDMQVHELSVGVYVLKVEDGSGTVLYQQKLVKQ